MVFKRLMLLLLFVCTFNLSSVLADESGDYQLGPNDVVRVTVFQHDELATEARISESGNISLPLVGEVKISELTAKQAQSLISSKYQAEQIVRSPQVTVFVSEFNSNMVSVLGNVRNPGQYPLIGRMTVLEMLAKAGGMTDDGGDEIVITTNNNGKISTRSIDLSKMLQQGLGGKDLLLTGNDVVYVPDSKMFYIYGEVRRPGAFKVKDGMTVMQALSLGGGLTERGTTRRIKVTRKLENDKEDTFSVQLTDRLQPDDVIRVKEGLF
ncbi:MAG: SLBB domain-containing protein [Gammaproteobacteria bacterium]